MGVIKMITPSEAIAPEQPIKKQTTMSSAHDLALKAYVPFQVYENYNSAGLNKITVERFDCHEETTACMLRKIDVLWLFGKWDDQSQVPGWNGYIQSLTKYNQDFSQSRILFLPFIHQPASNYNTIYTALHCVLENCKKHGHNTCVITFDQPLYIKAREIVASSPETSDFSKIIVRLGGFYLIMSFLGSIGYIMEGSGLKEVLSIIYAPNSVEKMLNGHAYARAIRGHTLLHQALSAIILNDINVDTDTQNHFRKLITEVANNIITYEDIENSDDDVKELSNFMKNYGCMNKEILLQDCGCNI